MKYKDSKDYFGSNIKDGDIRFTLWYIIRLKRDSNIIK
jgi:hypothetical protein